MSPKGRSRDLHVSGPKAGREARVRERGGRPTRDRAHLRLLEGGCRTAPKRGARRVGQRFAARSRGFTLVELTIALVLMAAIAALLYGSLSLAARTWDGGEAKMQQVADLRTTQNYLRSQIAAEYPQRMFKIQGFPLLFSGERDEMRYAAALPSRVAAGGVYYFRLAVVRDGDRSRLVQERIIPDVNALDVPQFSDAERSILAEGIAELRIAYFGRPADAADAVAPTWLDRWDDKQRLPMLVRIDVKPEKGAAWPTLVVEPRRSPEAGCTAWNSVRHICTRAG